MGFKQAMLTVGGGVLAASIVVPALVTAGGTVPGTHNAKWAAATKEYLKFQNMNPVGIGGRKAYDPEYLRKEE